MFELHENELKNTDRNGGILKRVAITTVERD